MSAPCSLFSEHVTSPTPCSYPGTSANHLPPSLKIHLHRWIIIKACYYIRNMKLKRPSSANEYDTLADMDADADPNSPPKPQLQVGNPSSILPLLFLTVVVAHRHPAVAHPLD